MLGFLSRLRQWRRARRLRRQIARLSQADEAALAGQAAPQPERVLVVRNDSIGDYLLYRHWLGEMSREVRARGQRLTLAANALWAPLARAWDAELFDELLEVDFGRFQRDLAYRVQTLAIVGAGGFGEVVYPLHVREPAVENFIRFMAAPVRVASQGEHRRDAWFQLLDAGCTRLLPAARDTLFEYERNREFFENWRGRPAPGPVPPPTLPASVAEAAAAHRAAGPYAVLFPGASARRKRWPATHFAALARGLHARYGAELRLVLAGSAADAQHARRIQKAAGPGVPLENRCGQTALPELAALLAGARLLVSNDTVAAHLATQAGTPCLVVLMGENYGKFFPYPPALHPVAPSRCLFPPDMAARFARGDFSRPDFNPDIRRVAPNQVLAAAVALLDGPVAG